jgi:hypothetical protein
LIEVEVTEIWEKSATNVVDGHTKQDAIEGELSLLRLSILVRDFDGFVQHRFSPACTRPLSFGV